MHDLKVVFMGTPKIAIPVFKYLIAKTKVVLVVTKADVKEVSFVKKVALENNIALYQPLKIKEEYQKIIDLRPDIIITCAYGQIIPKELLDCPKYGCFNLHASLLPHLRGAAPIQRAILEGDLKTGITLMKMDEGMDTGDIVDEKEIEIKSDDTYESLSDKLGDLAKDILEDNLNKIINNDYLLIKQDNEKATYAKMLKRDEEELSFNDQGINIIHKINAFYPSPLTYFKINNQEIKILKAHFVKQKETNNSILKEVTKDKFGISCKDGIIYLDIIKPSGKKIMDIKSYLNGVNKELLKGKIL